MKENTLSTVTDTMQRYWQRRSGFGGLFLLIGMGIFLVGIVFLITTKAKVQGNQTASISAAVAEAGSPSEENKAASLTEPTSLTVSSEPATSTVITPPPAPVQKKKEAVAVSKKKIVAPPPPPKITSSSSGPRVTVAAPPPPPPAPAESLLPLPALPPVRVIDPQSIVGLVCYFKKTTVDPFTGDESVVDDDMIRASGVIIDERGDILTSRHVVEREDDVVTQQLSGARWVDIVTHFSFKYCDVGQIPADAVLPTPDEVQTINPAIQVPDLRYQATLLASPVADSLTGNEKFLADFAFLKITGVNPRASLSGPTTLPSSFPYAKLHSASDVKIGDQVLTYGFPSDASAGRHAAFTTLFLTGSVGQVTSISNGTDRFAGVPLEVLTNMEIFGGRSGSPLFWRGYVVGLVQGYDIDNRTKSHSVASDAILAHLP